MLYLLAANAGRVVTREEILDALWGTDYVAESNVVDRQIRRLRARLQDDWREPRFIATVPGHGYRFLLPFTAGAGKGASFLRRRMAASADIEAARLWHLLGQRLTDAENAAQ